MYRLLRCHSRASTIDKTYPKSFVDGKDCKLEYIGWSSRTFATNTTGSGSSGSPVPGHFGLRLFDTTDMMSVASVYISLVIGDTTKNAVLETMTLFTRRQTKQPQSPEQGSIKNQDIAEPFFDKACCGWLFFDAIPT